MPNQRLQLTWYNKEKVLIPTETGKYGYRWQIQKIHVIVKHVP